MTEFYVYPDGTVAEEPYDWMSDDYIVILAEDEGQALMKAISLGVV